MYITNSSQIKMAYYHTILQEGDHLGDFDPFRFNYHLSRIVRKTAQKGP